MFATTYGLWLCYLVGTQFMCSHQFEEYVPAEQRMLVRPDTMPHENLPAPVDLTAITWKVKVSARTKSPPRNNSASKQPPKVFVSKLQKPRVATYAPPVTVKKENGIKRFFTNLKAERAKSRQITPANWGKVDMRKPGYRAVSYAARKHGVPERFALGVAAQENRGRCTGTSSAGARGVMQVMPATARKHGVNGYKLNGNCKLGADTGVRELKYCLRKAGGDKVKALVCYNAGPAWLSSKRYKGRRLPGETRNYIYKILGKKVQRVT